MAITFALDVAPHMRRARFFRAERQRYHVRHRHDGRALFWQAVLPSLLLFWGLVGYGIYSAL